MFFFLLLRIFFICFGTAHLTVDEIISYEVKTSEGWEEKKNNPKVSMKIKLVGQVRRFHTGNMIICRASAARQFK